MYHGCFINNLGKLQSSASLASCNIAPDGMMTTSHSHTTKNNENLRN